MYLEKILNTRRQSSEFQAGPGRQREFEQAAAAAGPVRDFAAALRTGPWPRIIAEIKRASPSRGLLKDPLDPADLARRYASGGASALSILTESEHFRGHPDDLRVARQAVDLPVLRKDFLLEPWELFASRAMGADAVLLIAAALSDESLETMHCLARDLGMAALIEVHDEGELARVLPLNPTLVGINNRNLTSFQVDRKISQKLGARLPPSVVRVSESGFFSRFELEELPEMDAFLVGESLVTAEDPALALRRLREGQENSVEA